jgi:hypothetical protein
MKISAIASPCLSHANLAGFRDAGLPQTAFWIVKLGVSVGRESWDLGASIPMGPSDIAWKTDGAASGDMAINVSAKTKTHAAKPAKKPNRDSLSPATTQFLSRCDNSQEDSQFPPLML